MNILLLNKEIKLADVRKTLGLLPCNTADCEFARTLMNEAYKTTLMVKMTGNLYFKIKKRKTLKENPC